MAQNANPVHGVIKDVSLALLQASGLLLTINLAVTAQVETSKLSQLGRDIKLAIAISSIVLGVSILLGILVVGTLTDVMEQLFHRTRASDTTLRWLSAGQSWTFLVSMALMIYAVVRRILT